ncbi:MAG TPA: hypothetical protein VGE88_08435 [Lysobacter sp.]
MPSSISSSDASGALETGTPVVLAEVAAVVAEGITTPQHFERPGFVRLTASDRPGVAQPVPERDIPPQPWGRILLGAALLFLLLMAAWEAYWRDYGAVPGYRNSNGAWAEQRRRIDQGEGGKTVLIGSSRILFDVQLPVWERLSGERPIQLALEGTSPVPVLEDLAKDPNFTGRLVIGVAPDLFFSGFAYRGAAIEHFHKQSPSQRSGHWLSKRLIEPYFAFYDPDFALATVTRRQGWPQRPGLRKDTRVRKLMVQYGPDRSTHMWRKVEVDPSYRAIARGIWTERLTGPPPPMMDTPAKAQQVVAMQIDRATRAIATLRARGVRVVFVRPPSVGDYYAFEQQAMPRARTWDVLLRRTATSGIHFEDYPQLQGYELPEWSHLTAADARRFTAQLQPLVEREFRRQEAARERIASAH